MESKVTLQGIYGPNTQKTWQMDFGKQMKKSKQKILTQNLR